jgi:hypothetical protein
MTDLAQIPVVAGGTTYQITGANLSSLFQHRLLLAARSSTDQLKPILAFQEAMPTSALAVYQTWQFLLNLE